MKEEVHEITEWFNNDDGSPLDFRLFFIGQKERQQLASSEPTEILVDDSVREWLRIQFQEISEFIGNKDFIAMEDIDEPAEEIIRYLPVKEIDILQTWLKNVHSAPLTSSDTPFSEVWHELKAKALILQVLKHETSMYLIKVLSESQTLRKKKILHLIPTGSFALAEEPTLVLDGHWDGAIIGDHLALFKEGSLLVLLQYYEKFRESADEFIRNLSRKAIFGNIEFLENVVKTRISLQKKLHKAAQGNLERIDFNRLQDFIRQGKIALTMSTEGKIECSTIQEAKVLIDVLMDNFVKSMLTDEEYKAYNKAALNANTE